MENQRNYGRERYLKYMQTEHWKTFSSEVKKECKFSCERCWRGIESGDWVAIHHKTYKQPNGKSIWYNERREDVECLCQPCHEFRHKGGADPARISKMSQVDRDLAEWLGIPVERIPYYR